VNPSTELFDLISSLSASEKRYFKLFAKRHDGNGTTHYMRIFEWVAKQNRYDESELIQALGDEKLVKQLPVLKNYLYKLLLKCLRSYHADLSVDFELKELAMNLELLMRKGLVKQAQKQLTKLEKLAALHERYEMMPEITGHKMVLLMKYAGSDLESLESSLQKTFQQAANDMERLANIQSYRNISMQMLMRNRRDPQAKSAESTMAYEQIMGAPLMQSESLALTRRAALYYRQSKFVYHYSKSEIQQAYEASMEIVDLMESSPHLVLERPENYVIALQNSLMMSTFVRPIEEILTRIDQLHTYQDRFPGIRFDPAIVQKVPIFAANIKLRLLYNHKRYQEAAAFLPEALSLLEGGYPYNVNEGYVLVDLYFMAAIVHLHQGHLRDAVKYVNKLINMEGLNADYEYYLDARLLYAIILLEANETQLLEYAVSSLQRYLQQKGKIFRNERLLLTFLKKAADVTSESMKTKLYEGLQRDIMDSPESKSSLSGAQFDLLGWLNHRLS
jgi:hypothetical protein